MINFTRIICLCSLSAALAASGMQCPPDRSAAVMSNLVYKTPWKTQARMTPGARLI